jgi:DNA helicase II / ATP-dependent DNA helicase PcrA
MPQTPFKKAIAALDPTQRKAVNALYGPVMVVAGPGTGKTHIMALRIGNILDNTDTDPSSILALTFTESAVSALRKRLFSIIGETAYRVPIHTFHSFSNTIIARFPEHFHRIIGATSASDVDQLDIIRSILKKGNYTSIRPLGDPYYFLKPILSTITELKRDAILPEQFAAIIKKDIAAYNASPDKIHTKGAHKGKMKSEFLTWQTHIERNKELLDVFEKYERELKRRKLYDYDDTIIETIAVMERESDVLATLQEEYQFVLADEHQDANNSQNRLLELLSSYDDAPNLFIVGDDKQAIFRFQGASLENFLYFQRKFPKAQLISLSTSYRSVASVLNATHGLAEQMPTAPGMKRVKLASRQKNDVPVQVVAAQDPEHEAEYIAHTIETLRKKNSPTIAIIVRENAETELYAQSLTRHGISFERAQSREIFAEPFFHHLITLYKIAYAPTDAVLLGQTLFAPFWQLSPFVAHEVLATSRTNRESLVRSLQQSTHADIKQLMRVVAQANSIAHEKLLLDAFTEIANAAGVPAYIAQHPTSEAHTVYTRLSREALAFSERMPQATLADFLVYLQTLMESGVSLEATPTATSAEVTLLTAHKSKGLEFDYVFVAGLTDRRWGGRVSRRLFHIPREGFAARDTHDDNDERRLLYVAITRARTQAVLTYPAARFDGAEELPSRFISELTADSIVQSTAPAIPQQHHKHRAVPINKRYQQLIANHLEEKGISPTSLARYLICPWEYIFVDVFKLPEPCDVHQLYGIAVHRALKRFFDEFAKGKKVAGKDLVNYFECSLREQPLLEDDFKRVLSKGKEALAGFVKHSQGRWLRTIRSELRVPRVVLPGIATFLTGIIDKIEELPNGSVRVIDYKVRKPTAITKEYARQLTFYKLLLERGQRPRSVSETRIDFIEPSKKGEYQSRQFSVTPEAEQELIQALNDMIASLTSLTFWNETCDVKDCKYCHLASSLQQQE